MKKSVMHGVVCLLFVCYLSACAQVRAYQSYAETAYPAYAAAMKAAGPAKACEINTADDVTIPRGFNLVCYQANALNNIAPPAQIKDSEWVGAARDLIGVGGMVGGIAVAGSMVKGIVREVGKSAGTNTINSNNPIDNHSINNSQNPVAVVPPVTVIPPVTVVETPVIVTPLPSTVTP